MGASQDDELIQATLEYLRDKVLAGDFFPFLFGIIANFKARRRLTKFFNENYAIVCVFLLWREEKTDSFPVHEEA